MAAATPDDDGEPRRLVRCKSNIGPDGDGIEYGLDRVPLPGHPGIEAQRIVWGERLDGRADALLREIERPDAETAAPARDAAVEWLRGTLAAGPVPKADIESRAAHADIKSKTLRNAAGALGIVKAKAGYHGGWTWALPSKMPSAAEDALPKSEGTFGAGGHLRPTGTDDAETF